MKVITMGSFSEIMTYMKMIGMKETMKIKILKTQPFSKLRRTSSLSCPNPTRTITLLFRTPTTPSE